MWALHVFLLAVILAFILTACGNVATQLYAYVWTDSDTLLSLTWHNQNNSLSGDWTSVSYKSTPFPASTQPDVTTMGYTGTMTTSGVVTLTIGRGLHSETLSGQQDSDSEMLQLSGIDPAAGQTQRRTLIAVTQQQEAALLAVFNAYEVVRGMLPVVQRDARTQATISDPNASSVSQAQEALREQQAELAAMQQAQDTATKCQDVAYQPIDTAYFTLLFTPSDNPLVHDYNRLTHAWNGARHLSLPQIAGLSVAHLPWIVSIQAYQRGTQQASALVARIEATYRQDERTMQQLKQQDQAIAEQVTTIGKNCPPMPG